MGTGEAQGKDISVLCSSYGLTRKTVHVLSHETWIYTSPVQDHTWTQCGGINKMTQLLDLTKDYTGYLQIILGSQLIT